MQTFSFHIKQPNLNVSVEKFKKMKYKRFMLEEKHEYILKKYNKTKKIITNFLEKYRSRKVSYK